ncbi:acetyl-CoA synthetase-like protein [Lojkania enalia]|uniref:Acetyl-CoA synthetase-like protein n=1 Tax=Lojkania enalia TaxID=147567 RepID=A0A9P4NBR1_9PLEO|nr:acetyl-CoA synthetase-like protein [Didymosphaeria enalia]
MDIMETSNKILDIIFEYALNKFDDSKERLAAGRTKFLSVIDQFIMAETQVQMCLPAFPFKSANKVYKVFGILPDKAEELALQRLNTMCIRVGDVYAPGAKVTIISDGLVYNDLLCIPDRDTWAYGEALRAMSVQKGFDHIDFSRLRDLVNFPLPQKLKEITYVANATNFRRFLFNKYGKEDLDIDDEIATNPDTRMTYLGYRRFLESDLQYIFTLGEGRTSNGYKRDVKYLAKQMLIRGYAFAGAVKAAFPRHLRLSIHQSVGEHKVSMSLLNTKTGFTTPWHCSIALMADGEWISAPKGDFEKDPRLEIVYENGRPSYFREKPWEPPDAINDAKLASNQQASKKVNEFSASLANNKDATEKLQFQPSTLTSPYLNNSTGYTSTQYGKRLIPQILDSLASTNPDRIILSVAEFSDNFHSFRRITAHSFAQAVDKTAWWLQRQVGKPTLIQPVAYIGPHDIRHILLTYACVKAGYAALFLSPKNNTEGALAVLDAVKCNIWVKPREQPCLALVGDILQQRSMKLLNMPEIDELLDAERTEFFPYNKTFEEAINDPFCFLHTSGTTGVPKPIPWSHGLIGTMDAVRLLPPTEGDGRLAPWTSDWKEGDAIYSSFPMSHGAGIIMNILMPSLFGLHCVLGPASVLPNMNLIESLADHGAIDIWSMVPSLVDELGETPDVLAKFKSSKFICASGGPVSPISAGKVNEVIRVLNLIGTTEGLFIGNLLVEREDWLWFAFHPFSGFEFKETEPETYEHWVHRNKHSDLFQGIFHTFPDKQSINFKDLYVKHPTKPNLWAFKGRSDDLVVLSNGYKISPLDTEAFITAHPAIESCLVIGTGKPQAGLLIELKDPSSRDDEVLDSIWLTVEKANTLSRHKSQLLRDYIAFADPEKPFIRTDKGTVERKATLALYADYIERFYISRGEHSGAFMVDTNSVDSIMNSIRPILGSLLPTLHEASPDADFFNLGLDSLLVFQAVKTIGAAMGLQNQLAPRHLYASPTLAKFSTALARLTTQASKTNGMTSGYIINDGMAKMKRMIYEHKARLSFKLNPFDYVNPNHYMGINFYFALREGVTFKEAFSNLQDGLLRTMKLIPAIGGKMMNCSEQEIGYQSKGDLCVTIPPLSLPDHSSGDRTGSSTALRQLTYKNLSNVLPPFEQLRDAGFVPSAFKDELVFAGSPFPPMPTDILVAQANFVKGGCILATNFNHCCLDGIGVMVALKAWAENCRYLQGDMSATCSWFDSESSNHSLPEILYELEGYARPVHEVDPGVWGFLPFLPPEEPVGGHAKGIQEADKFLAPKEKALPLPPAFPRKFVWPPPPVENSLSTTMFLISPEKVQKLKQEVIADPEAKGVITSISDIVQAFFWRSAIKARYRVAKELRGETFGPDEISVLELPTDGRPYFSSLLPSTYMGSMLILNRPNMPIETLCSPETSIGRVAYLIREATARITPSLVHDAFSLLRSLPDHSRFTTACMGLDGMHAMISNLILFQTSEISFGNKFFADGGSPEVLRLQIERGHKRFRFLVIYPMKKDGGVELVLGTFPEELEMFMKDEEFTKYAKLMDSCHSSSG